MSELWQHAGEDFQTQILLIAETVGASLDDANLVVEALDKAEGDFVVGMAVGHDAIPVLVDQGGELLVRLQALPFERLAPVVKKAACPTRSFVAPQLFERFLEKVGGVQTLVGVEQQFQSPPSGKGEVSPAGQQRVLLALDEASPRPGEAGVFALADLVQGFLQM